MKTLKPILISLMILVIMFVLLYQDSLSASELTVHALGVVMGITLGEFIFSKKNLNQMKR